MILSHHGKKEYGCPVEPIIKEAYMLYYIDDMDAKYHEMNKAIENLEPGEISKEWRVPGIDHKVYRPVGC